MTADTVLYLSRGRTGACSGLERLMQTDHGPGLTHLAEASDESL